MASTAPDKLPNRSAAGRALNDHPLLEARSLTLQHRGGTGVHDFSLLLHRGDVLGLLGLNGAGKSTTLRLLSGVLQPDTGQVTIDGHSLAEFPLLARARIGYLPDQPPLYDDMRVSEYLTLAARVRGLSRQRARERLATVLEQCELGDVQRCIIATLSKGYRQRIGLAQALIHEPAVVLLDEPANGLDPRQMDGMRRLIQEVSRDRAVIFSTHLIGEVTITCNRVAILHEGRLVSDRPVEGEDIAELFRETVA